MTGPDPGPYGGEGYNPAPQPQFGAPQPLQYPPAPQPPQYPPAPQPPQYGQPPTAPYGQAPPPPPYGQAPPQPPYGQAPPQPPYGQPPAPPFGQQPVPNRKPLIYGGIAGVVLIIAIIVTVVLVTGGSGGSPKGVLEDYLTAAKNGDAATVKDLTCDKYKADATASSADSDLGDLGSIDFEVQDSHENGDTATVNLKITYTANLPNGGGGSDLSGSATIPVTMVKEHGAWKVCMKD